MACPYLSVSNVSADVKNKTKLQCTLCKLQKGWMFQVGLLPEGSVLGTYPGRSRLVIRSVWTKALSGVDTGGLRRL